MAERLAAQQAAADELKNRDQQRQAELDQLRGSLPAHERDKATLLVTLEKERENAAEKMALLQEAEKKLKDAFQALASDALLRNNQSFLDLAKTAFAAEQQTAQGELEKRQVAIGALVDPVKEALTKVEAKIQDIEKSREGAYSELRTQVQTLHETGQQLRKETANLAGALRSSNVAGNWGQMQLRQVVKLAGMVEHCDFAEQFSMATDDGRLRPDMIVSLPGNRTIAIDAKVPLSALLDANEATDDEHRGNRLKDYARNLLRHVNDLGKKEYWKQFEQSPDFVVLFLPGETFFYAAQEQEPELIAMAWDQRVVIATPSTLIALLRAVAFYWQQEQLAENALEIRQIGNKLYESLAGLAQAFQMLGSNLKSSINCYNDAVSRLENSVFYSAEILRTCAAPANKAIKELEPLEIAAREIQRAEFLASPDDSGEVLESRT